MAMDAGNGFAVAPRGVDAGLGMMESASGETVDQALAVGQRILERRVITNPVTIVEDVLDIIDLAPVAVNRVGRLVSGNDFHRVRVLPVR